MYTVQLKLKTDAHDAHFLDQCFRCCERIEQRLQSHAMKQLRKLRMDEAYRKALAAYRKAKAAGGKDAAAAKALEERISYYGLTKFGLEKFVQVQQKRYKKYVPSHVAQKLAENVCSGVGRILYSKGKTLHFRKLDTRMTFEAKKKDSCIIFEYSPDRYICGQVRLCGHKIAVKKIREKDLYLDTAVKAYAISGSYARIKRVPTPTGWDYYVQLVIKGMPPAKHVYGEGRVGIDIGTSTIACVSETACLLEVLDEQVDSIGQEISRIQRKIDRSRRATNPGNYRPDGRVIPGRKHWVQSHAYRKLRREHRALCARRSRILKMVQEIRADRILEMGTEVYVEQMNFAALAKRSSKTGEDASGRCKRKKRFGRSVGIRAPAQQLAILDRKLGYTGRGLIHVDTQSFKASQYDHVSDTYTKKQLSQRTAWIGGALVQRDLYSAFLLMNADETLEHADRGRCMETFPVFLSNQKQCISALLAGGHKTMASFGLKAFA